MGRPKLNVKQVGVQLTPEILERLRAMFGDRRDKRAVFIRQALQKALDEAEGLQAQETSSAGGSKAEPSGD